MLKNKRGITLIELLIIVVIIGVLAVLAVPRFKNSTLISKQAEAKDLLRQIYEEEVLCRAGGGYADLGVTCKAGETFTGLGLTIPPGAQYIYSISGNSGGFTAKATANIDDDSTIDEWIVTENGRVKCVTNDVKE
jgi:type II secretory pathway pseudopilin PulG